MEITVKIYKASVTYLARLAVAYVGAKNGDYQRLLVADSETEMTEMLWEEARSEALEVLKCLSMAAAAGADIVEGSLAVPRTFAAERRADVQLWLNQYFTHALAASWLAIAGRSEAEPHQAKASSCLKSIMIATAPRTRR